MKSVRVANYLQTLRRDLIKVAEACGVEHPGLIDTDAVEILDGRTGSTPLHEVYGYRPDWGLPSAADQAEIIRLMTRGGAAGCVGGAVRHRNRVTSCRGGCRSREVATQSKIFRRTPLLTSLFGQRDGTALTRS